MNAEIYFSTCTTTKLFIYIEKKNDNYWIMDNIEKICAKLQVNRFINPRDIMVYRFRKHCFDNNAVEMTVEHL